jgi:hypothetical protein
MLARDGGMNVPNITQSLGSVATLARAEAPTEAASHPASAPAVATSTGTPIGSGSNGVSLARLAWFDVNGDGHIDPRSTTSGGDATLLVPSHSVDLPTYRRTVNDVGGPRPANPRETPPAMPANPAQASRAATAYQRYGEPASTATLPASSTATGADRTVS